MVRGAGEGREGVGGHLEPGAKRESQTLLSTFPPSPPPPPHPIWEITISRKRKWKKAFLSSPHMLSFSQHTPPPPSNLVSNGMGKGNPKRRRRERKKVHYTSMGDSSAEFIAAGHLMTFLPPSPTNAALKKKSIHLNSRR